MKINESLTRYNDFYENTVRFLESEDLNLFDLSKVSAQDKERYGNTRLGQGLLLAKRLVHGDVRFIEVNNGGWDTHTENFEKLAKFSKNLKNKRGSKKELRERCFVVARPLLSRARQLRRRPGGCRGEQRLHG